MGFTPIDVGQMSYWHFMAALDGCSRANGWKADRDTSPTMSDARLAELGIDGF